MVGENGRERATLSGMPLVKQNATKAPTSSEVPGIAATNVEPHGDGMVSKNVSLTAALAPVPVMLHDIFRLGA